MSECIRKWIKISNIEDLGKFKYIILLAVFLFSLIIFPEYAFVFLLVYIASSSYQMLSLHKRNNSEELLLTSHLSKTQLILSMFSTCILNSLYILPIIVVLLIMKFDASIKIAIIIAIINYIFASSIGLLIGSFIKNQLAGIAIIIGFLVYTLGGTNYVTQESKRYISALLQLNDVSSLYWSNLIGILGFTILFIAIAVLIYARNKTAVRYTIVLGISALLIIGLNFYNDVTLSNRIKDMPYSTLEIDNKELKYRETNPELAKEIGQIVYSYEDEVKELQLPIPFYKVKVTKEIYFFYDKVHIVEPNDDKTLQVNIISPAVNNMNVEHFFVQIAPAILQIKSKHTNIQQDIIKCIRDEIQYRAIVSNKYNVFTEYDINMAKLRKKDRGRYYSIESKEYGKDINNFMNYVIEKYPNKLKYIYTLCIIENKPKTEEEVYSLIKKKYPSILSQYKGGEAK